ncbi:hypothetical protein PAECIP111891_02290 [Paenibacillus allorhizoplanae]|uniref:Uncharacterized protein n=1 Tax=Paenibacillus allorhizoplanae TaxID=2905648 RepID=A0ABM9C3L4_9BACL|nr:hypothetical protein PAECIP111891_02290 [Paenibacillus allorhizoplanae]
MAQLFFSISDTEVVKQSLYISLSSYNDLYGHSLYSAVQ